MTSECPACGYVRQPTDDAPDWQCPSCQRAYSKISAQPSEKVIGAKNKVERSRAKEGRSKKMQDISKNVIAVGDNKPVRLILSLIAGFFAFITGTTLLLMSQVAQGGISMLIIITIFSGIPLGAGYLSYRIWPTGVKLPKPGVSYKERYCTNCQAVMRPRLKATGTMGLELGLWVLALISAIFTAGLTILAALVYSIYRQSAKRVPVCTKCGEATVIPIDSPRGQRELKR